MFASCERCRRSFDTTKSQQKCPQGCRTVYCSRNCRRANKKAHDKVCQFLKTFLGEASPPRRQEDEGVIELRPVYPPISPEEQAQRARVDQALFIHVASERKVFHALIDSFRLRTADLVAQRAARETTDGLDYRRICADILGFSNYLDAAEPVFGLLPGWWSPEKRAECERTANEGGDDEEEADWYSLSREVDAQEIEEYYERHGGMSVLQLRLLAVAVMGYGLGNFDVRTL